MYIFRKEIYAPAWQWESSCIEQPRVWADLNEFRFILDIQNEVRVISGKEKRAGSLLSFPVCSLSCQAHCRLRKLWCCPPSRRGKREPALAQLCLGSESSLTLQGPPVSDWVNLATSLFFKNKSNQCSCLLTFASPTSKPCKHQPFIKTLSNFFCFYPTNLVDSALPVVEFTLLGPLGNLCWHFHHRLWSEGYKLVGNSSLGQYL